MDPLLLLVVVVLAAAVAGIVVWRARRQAPPPEAAAPAEPSEIRAPAGLQDRLGKTRRALAERLGSVLGRSGFDDGFWEDLEDGLVASDMGVAAAAKLVAAVRLRAPVDGVAVRSALTEELIDLLAGRERGLDRSGSPSVMLVVGVNGTGKTTSIAKLAAMMRSQGHEVLLGAADTFRAAADEQLRTWAERIGVDIVGGQAGADPASVAFDAYQSAKAKGHDLVIIDTAGRLQTKANLMDELGKVARVLRREAGEIDEVLLVIDGTTGQNALAQARTFADVVGVTGVLLTKLDGSARGGVAIAVEEELGIPVKFIGIGEGMDDLVAFEPAAFVEALLG
jgi:fused signal recognition particle receptor